MIPTSVDEAVSQYVREFREARGLTLTQIAEAGQIYGASWGAASVRAIETGQAALTLEKLIILTLALRLMNDGQALRLDDLIGNADRLQIGRGGRAFTVSREWLRDVLSGGFADPTIEGVSTSPAYRNAQFVSRNKSEFGLPNTANADTIMRTVPTGAEKRAAKKLDWNPLAVALWAKSLWGHSLDEEARARAGDDATPQARGRITRGLVDELVRFRNDSEHGAPA